MSDNREERNAVFGTPAGQQFANMQRSMKEEFDVEIPYETVPLPSQGLVYPEGSPVHRAISVDIKPMSAKEEDILTSRALIKKGTAITHLIRSCLIDKRILVEDLLSGDRNTLMVAIRITGYGPEYKVEITCPACEAKFEHEFDLSKLPLKKLNVDPNAGGCSQVKDNLFRFALPIARKEVHFKFLTGRDEEEISLMEDRKKKANIQVDNLITNRLKYAIQSLGGETDRNKISRFVDNMPARDSLALRKHIEAQEPGIEMKSKVICQMCNEEREVGVELTSFFFWPSQ